MTTVSGGKQLVNALLRHDVDTVFGIPGVQLYDLVDALQDAEEISFILPKHEQSTTYMADGYARVTRKPGVAMVVPGPGVLNATAGLSTAYACSSPVLLIAGQIDSNLIDAQKYGALHELPDQTGLLRNVCKWVGSAKSADEIPDLVSLAFFHMFDGVPGPVAIEIPPDVLAEQTQLRDPAEFLLPTHGLPADTLERVRSHISRSDYPYILAGGGVVSSGAHKEVIELAELLECPVVLTRNGRGAVDATHRLVLDPHRLGEITDKSDLAIILGSRMGTGAGTYLPPGDGPIININVDPSQLVHPRPKIDLPIVGDVKTSLVSLLEDLRNNGYQQVSKWTVETIARIREDGVSEIRDISPQLEFLNAIQRATPEDSIFVSEYTQVGYVATITYPTKTPGGFISPGYQGTLGYGFATAIGTQVAAPHRRVVSINGDGGFAWTMPELATLRRYDIPLITIIFNDGRYGNVYRSQKYDYDGRTLASEITNPDFKNLALAHGIEFHSATQPYELEVALTSSVQGTPRPVLIEVIVDEFPSPWHHFSHAS